MRSLRFAATTALLLSVATPALAEWHRIEGSRFVVIGDDSERNTRAAIRELERFDLVLRRYFGLPSEGTAARKLPIYMLSVKDLQDVYGRDARVGGFYVRSTDDIFATAPRRGELPVIKHEYAHHFLASEHRGAFPAWFHEGFAQYFSTVEFVGNQVNIGKPPWWTANGLGSGWIPLERLLTERPVHENGTVPSTYYPLAWLLTHWFLKDNEGRAKLDTYLTLVAAGTPSVEAMEQATGLSLGELRTTLGHYSESALGFRTATLTLEPEFNAAQRLPASTDALMVEYLSLRTNVRSADRARKLNRIRNLAAPFGNDPFAQLVLGYAEFRLAENFGQAESHFEAVLAREPANVDALIWLGRIYMHRADAARADEDIADLRAKAQRRFAAAYAADPANPFVLVNLGRNRRFSPSYPNQNDLATLQMAYEIAPQHPYTGINLAEALIKLNRLSEAEQYLIPLINDPHRSDAQAEELLRRIRAARTAD